MMKRWGLINTWRLLFGVSALQGTAAVLVFLNTISKGRLLLGISNKAYLVVILAIIIVLFCLYQLLQSFIAPDRAELRANRWTTWINQPGRFGYIIIFLSILLIICACCLTFVPEVKEPFSRVILGSLSPFITWTGSISGLMLSLLFLHNRKSFPEFGKANARFFWLMMGYFMLILIGWIWMIHSIYPIISERVGWNSLGVPVLEYQTGLAWFAGALVLYSSYKLNKRNIAHPRTSKTWYKDLGIAAFIWASAVILWQAQPIQPNWFVSEKLSPNYEYYPYSDARAYDENAQSALIGHGFLHYNNIEIRRPLHAAYLTVLHLIGGQDYEKVIFLQIMVLALLPVGLYFVTKSLHNRASGLMAAFLVIFRESNSIAGAAKITSSHVKLLMVDLLTAMIVVFFSVWAVLWLRQLEKGPSYSALLSGGTLGLAMLVRSETFVLALAPLILVGINFLSKRKFKCLFLHISVFLFSLILVIAPWMVRNYQRTGRFTLDSAAFRQLFIIQRFQPLEKLDDSLPDIEDSAAIQESDREALIAPAEPVSTESAEAAPTPAVPGESDSYSKASSLLQAALKHPDELLRVFAAHYLNNQIQMLLVYPATFRPIDSGINLIGHKKIDKYLDECCSLTGYTRRLPFWKKWDGQLPQQSTIPLLLTMLILSAGITLSKSRKSSAGMMPGLAAFLFIFFNSVLRNSGGRYLLPVDWTSIVYYSIGAMQISQAAFRLVNSKLTAGRIESGHPISDVQKTKWSLFSPGILAAMFGLLVIGYSIPLIERLSPERYTIEKHDQMLNAVLSPDADLPPGLRKQLLSFLDNGGTTVSGRGLYPQVFPANYGTQESATGPRSPQPYLRLVFDLISNLTLRITLPINDPAVYFPNASDTLVFLCQNEFQPQTEPLAVAVFNLEGQFEKIYLRDPTPEKFTCPLSDQSQ